MPRRSKKPDAAAVSDAGTSNAAQPPYVQAWKLSAKDATIVAGIVDGESIRDVAHKIHSRPQVVKNRLRIILDKVQVPDRLSLEIAAEKLDSSIAEGWSQFSLAEPLKPRQLQLLAAVAGGKKYGEIAHDFNISEQTLKNHVKAIFVQIGADDRVHASRMYRLGIAPLIAREAANAAAAANAPAPEAPKKRRVMVAGVIKYIS